MRLPSILLYWLLLLVPTLALGFLGWRLLREEERRLTEAAEAAELERAGIVAENLTLFLEEARGGVIAGLSELPLDDPGGAMEAWTEANPLVRRTFVWRPHTGVVPPTAGPGEGHSAFLHRHALLLAPRPRWETGLEAAEAPQRWLREEAARAGGQMIGLEAAFDDAPLSPTPRQELKQMADVARVAVNIRQQESFGGRVARDLGSAEPARGEDIRLRAARREVTRATASGWIPLPETEPPAAIAWIELQPSGEVRGAEVDFGLILERMLAVLPSGREQAGRYRLVDHAGNLFPVGEPGAFASPVQLEIGSLLPGWRLAVDPVGGNVNAGRGFFLLSLLLLGVLLTSILSGGSLLLYQAHRHQVDARRKSSFVSNVSHELKTPLTTIRMYAELIGSGRVREAEKKRGYLDVIIGESERLTRLINNVLDFSRLEQGRGQREAVQVDLNVRLAELLDAQEPRVEAAGMRLVRRIPEGTLTCLVEPDALEQAVLNLLDNAVKYAAGGGELRVEAVPDGDRVGIHVMDEGPGVPPGRERRLFEEFYRGDSSLTARQPGCGLGLNIARRLLRRNGGDLVYAPRSSGGARFTIQLPRFRPSPGFDSQTLPTEHGRER